MPITHRVPETPAPQEIPDFRKSEVGKPEVKSSDNPEDFRFSEVQTSENQTVIILNLIKLILAYKNQSIHHAFRRAAGMDG